MAHDPVLIIKRLADLSAGLSTGNDGGKARAEALRLSNQLTASLQQPENVAVDLLFSPLLAVAARIAIDLDLFNRIANHGKPITSKELSSLSGGEELLIIRILRPMASLGFVDEVGERTWTATPVTKAMTVEGIAAGHRVIGKMIVGAALQAPKYLREAGHQCPTDPRDGFMQYAFQTKLPSFDLYRTMPEVFNDFNLFMGATMGARQYWIDWFPIEERLMHGLRKESALVVDVGAGRGHDLLALHSKHPGQGRLVLQDQAAVTEELKDMDPAIELMAYDFFTEQPVRGARAYFYHHILHDWSDQKCLEILEQVRDAMEPGYSKLLIHEMFVPEKGAATFYALLDFTMMAFNAGMERTERQWEDLLSRVGFDVVRFWQPPEEGADGIIEAMISVSNGVVL